MRKSERAGEKGKKEEGQPGSIVFGMIYHCEHNFHVFSVKKSTDTHNWLCLSMTGASLPVVNCLSFLVIRQ